MTWTISYLLLLCGIIPFLNTSGTPVPPTNSTVVDGGWSDWSSSDCSVTCGNGTKTKTRTCTNPAPQNGGANCTGQSTRTKNCSEDPCMVDGGWSSWNDWSACSVTCGDGNKTRLRLCNNPPAQNGGQDCQGDDQEARSCSRDPCPINGGFSEWGPWGSCEGSSVHICNGIGVKRRFRTCTNPIPQHGGDLCTVLGPYDQRTPCTSTEACPVNGGWGAWGAYSECSETCGVSSSRIRTRECDNPVPSNGGDQCVGDGTESQPCDGLPACPTQPAPAAGGGCDDGDTNCQDSVTTVMTTDIIDITEEVDVATVTVFMEPETTATDTTTGATTTRATTTTSDDAGENDLDENSYSFN